MSTVELEKIHAALKAGNPALAHQLTISLMAKRPSDDVHWAAVRFCAKALTVLGQYGEALQLWCDAGNACATPGALHPHEAGAVMYQVRLLHLMGLHIPADALLQQLKTRIEQEAAPENVPTINAKLTSVLAEIASDGQQ